MPATSWSIYWVSLIGMILLVAIVALWIPVLAGLASPNSSDPAGNGLAGAYIAAFTIAIWIMLGILLILAGTKGDMPRWTAILASILVPVSCASAVAAGAMIAELDELGVEARWLLILPTLVPLLLIFFALWAYLPSLHVSVPVNLAGGAVWSLVAILSVLPWPMIPVRTHASEARHAAQEKEAADLRVQFAKLTAESPLWEWTPFAKSTYEMHMEALNHIRTAPTRQADAEIMLDRGDFPMLLLFDLKLDPTPELCQKFRNFLAKREQSMRLKVPQSQSIKVIAIDLDAAINSMNWLTGNHCDCRDLGAAYLATANSYKDAKLAGRNLIQLKAISDGTKP
jgi:hypothetical protein